MNPCRLAPLAFLLLVPASAPAQSHYPPSKQVKEDFLRLLDRPKVPLDTKVSETKAIADKLVEERLDFASEKRADGGIERVPTLVIRPEGSDKKRPAVIVLHGTGGHKQAMRSWLRRLAQAGFVAVAIDARYHGDRSGGVKGAEAYVEAITKAWRAKPDEPQAHPFYYDTCWDIWRTLDYLETRDDVDPARIGMYGVSMGGIETWLAGAVDDRVKVAVPALAAQSFRWSLGHDQWQGRARTIYAAHEAAAKDLGKEAVDSEACRSLWEKVVPGILGEYDCPSMLRLFAGRPLLILSGDQDPNCPIDGARIAFAVARRSFSRAGASDRLKIKVARGVGHSVTTEHEKAAVAWFETWLKPDE